MIKMEADVFQRTVEKVVLYPGPLDELNEIEKKGSGKVYELVEMRDQKRYVEGYLVPDVSKIKEGMKQFQDFLQSKDSALGEFISKMLGGKENPLEDLFSKITPKDEDMAKRLEKVFDLTPILEGDIRLQSVKYGGDGLIHFRPVSQGNYTLGFTKYTGVPVKLKQ